MTRGALIYSEQEAARNAFAISKFKAAFAARGIELALVLAGDAERLCAEKPTFAVVRTMAPDLSAALESAGVRTFNTAEVSRIANDKRETFSSACAAGIPAVLTALTAKEALFNWGFPLVVKPARGHGGAGVALAKNAEQLRAAEERIAPDDCIYQPPTGEWGVDLRCYILGGVIVAAMKRRSQGDFRSNFCLGGSAESYSISPQQRESVMRVASFIRADYVGLDFFFCENRLLLNEIEDVVGARMLYAETDIDILERYAEHICGEL